MNRNTRRRLDTGHRVFALSKAHMTQVQGYVEAVTALGEHLARAEALAAQQETGDMQAGAAVVRKDELRETMESDYAVHLARIARASLPNDPELRRLFRVPKRGLNKQEFVAALRAMLAEAASRREVFIKEGMPETFVEDLEAHLARYVGAINEKGLGEAMRVGAVASLPEVSKEIMALIRRLDAINRLRWADNPELLAAWRSAKDVTWPHPKPAEPGGGSGASAA